MSREVKGVVKSTETELKRVTIIPQDVFNLYGTSNINLWGGGTGTVEMDEVTIRSELTLNTIKENINDGQFGCESINSARIFVDQLFVEISEILDPHLNVIKRNKSEFYKNIINDRYIKLKG